MEVSFTFTKAKKIPEENFAMCMVGVKGIVYYELLQQRETVNSERYCQQLQNLNNAIKEKRPALFNRTRILFHQDNARPHIAVSTQKKILGLVW